MCPGCPAVGGCPRRARSHRYRARPCTRRRRCAARRAGRVVHRESNRPIEGEWTRRSGARTADKGRCNDTRRREHTSKVAASTSASGTTGGPSVCRYFRNAARWGLGLKHRCAHRRFSGTQFTAAPGSRKRVFLFRPCDAGPRERDSTGPSAPPGSCQPRTAVRMRKK